MTPKDIIHVPSYFTASGPPRASSLTIEESTRRYGTIVFASSYAVDLAHRERLAKGPYARDIEIGLWLSMVPEEFRPRVVPLAAELAPKVLEHLGGAGRMKLDTQNETMVVDWLVGAIVYRIEELGGRAWLGRMGETLSDDTVALPSGFVVPVPWSGPPALTAPVICPVCGVLDVIGFECDRTNGYSLRWSHTGGGKCEERSEWMSRLMFMVSDTFIHGGGNQFTFRFPGKP